MTIRKENYAEIIAGCLSAFDCAKRGEEHERLNKTIIRTIGRITASYPRCPAHLLPLERQPFSLSNPAPIITTKADREYAGIGWSVKQD
ncbi:hypothetical protein DVP89_16995 [Yersinia enterocolitica]|uniref:hypothetical protein n=1 Tax=Yersinia vastinensis TaxID=2890318 RepID=UPI0011A9A1D6|nr:hypothetical protein [Yersinia vastinensis]EKN6195678.1 hypothetical protein [Yersinia enterocolitica]EKN6355372.1 hypothetical protein [Yersinia enterocolitica]